MPHCVLTDCELELFTVTVSDCPKVSVSRSLPVHRYFIPLDNTALQCSDNNNKATTGIMLALKKKREAEQKQAAAEAAAEASNGGTAPAKLSLLGVGGKKQVKNGDSANTVKKRTPGEIRIQKGAFLLMKWQSDS